MEPFRSGTPFHPKLHSVVSGISVGHGDLDGLKLRKGAAGLPVAGAGPGVVDGHGIQLVRRVGTQISWVGWWKQCSTGAELDHVLEYADDRGSGLADRSQCLVFLLQMISAQGIIEVGAGMSISPFRFGVTEGNKSSIGSCKIESSQDGFCPGVGTCEDKQCSRINVGKKFRRCRLYFYLLFHW